MSDLSKSRSASRSVFSGIEAPHAGQAIIERVVEREPLHAEPSFPGIIAKAAPERPLGGLAQRRGGTLLDERGVRAEPPGDPARQLAARHQVIAARVQQ